MRNRVMSTGSALMIAAVLFAPAAFGQKMERNVDRPGGDYRDFDLPRAEPGLCQAACAKEGECKAWTYVKPGVQGDQARCWLKSEVPDPVENESCVSGVKGATAPAAGMEQDTDRPGSDYRDFDLARPEPALCQAACTKGEQCKAWTYVKPGVQGDKARCWLKSEVPDAAPSDCCVSGVKK
jgi:hypothetical protein